MRCPQRLTEPRPDNCKQFINPAKMKPKNNQERLGSPDDMDQLQHQLAQAERSAAEWRERAEELEETIENLSEEQNKIKQMSAENTISEDQAALAIGKLQTQHDILKGELKQKEKGLALWKQKDQQHEVEKSVLKKRMDEMSAMIRERDSELLKMKQKEGHYREKITTLNTKIFANAGKGMPDGPKSSLPPVVKFKTMPAKFSALLIQEKEPDIKMRTAPAKLPAIVKGKGLLATARDLLTANTNSPRDDGEGQASHSVMPCLMSEKWMDRGGGEIQLPTMSLFIPGNSVSGSVLISMTQTRHEDLRNKQIASAGLEVYLQPGMQVRLQPHGFHFLRPVFLELREVKVQGVDRMIVYHKDVDYHADTLWTDITSDCSPKMQNQNAILAIDKFSIIETIKILIPVMAGSLAAGFALGYNLSLKTHAIALMNGKTCACDIRVFHNHREQCLVVHCTSQESFSNNNNATMDKESDLVLLGTQPTRFDLCDQERLFFYYHGAHKMVASFVFDWDKSSKQGGQKFKLSLNAAESSPLPKSLIMRRRVVQHVEEQDLCEVYLNELDCVDGIVSRDKMEQYKNTIRKCRVKLVKDLDVQQIMDFMRQENVFNLRDQEEIYGEVSTEAKASKFLDKLSGKGSRGFDVFCVALRDSHEHLAKELSYAVSQAVK